MRQVSLEELSGLMDGELDPARADEVREEIARNPPLRAEFERLSQLDAACVKAGAQASFQPKVSLPATAVGQPNAPGAGGLRTLLALAALLLIHLMPKVVGAFSVGVAVHVAALGAVLWAVWRWNAQAARYALSDD